MTDQVKVKVARHGAKRNSRNLMMYYVDPVTEKRVTRSAGTADRREADRRAAVWEDELNSGRYHPPGRITWQEFRQRYEQEKLAMLAEATQDAGASAMNHLERVIDPKRLAGLTSDTLSRFQAGLRKEGMKDTTIGAHLGHLRSAFSWAVSVGLLARMPEIHKPKKAKGRNKMMRGRPITPEEFDRMLEVVPKLRPHDPGTWQQYLTGLWLSGLRLEESLVLSWDQDAAFAIDLSGRHPRFRIYAEVQKRGVDEYFPMTPDFAEFILQTPQDERQGRVFRVDTLYGGQPMGSKRVSRILSKFGEKAGVVVNKADGKFASAHDLRRAFGTRWAPRVKPATLQRLMRHRSIETTLTYYVALDADDITAELWREHGSPHTLPHTTRNRVPHSA